MAKAFDPEKRTIGKVCDRHPELGGLRIKSNLSCVQCLRDASKRRADLAREAAGKVKRIPPTQEEVAERTRRLGGFNSETRVIGRICEKHPELLGLRLRCNSTCIKCASEATKKRQDKRREAEGRKKFVPMNPEEAMERIRQRDILRNKLRRLDPAYNEKQLERKRKWQLENAERVREVNRAYDAKQRAENIQRRLSKNLRHRLRKAMLGETSGVSAVRDLGMTIEEFRAYLEERFAPGMSWSNYGKWHIDHIRPLKSFDLTDTEQAKAACHFSNLQPLWAEENIRKWSRVQPTDKAENQSEFNKTA